MLVLQQHSCRRDPTHTNSQPVWDDDPTCEWVPPVSQYILHPYSLHVRRQHDTSGWHSSLLYPSVDVLCGCTLHSKYVKTQCFEVRGKKKEKLNRTDFTVTDLIVDISLRGISRVYRLCEG